MSLWPSIGNWSFPCRSHYWVVENRVEWSYDMTPEEIDAGRRRDAWIKDRYVKTGKLETPSGSRPAAPVWDDGKPEALSWWEKLKRWLGS